MNTVITAVVFLSKWAPAAKIPTSAAHAIQQSAIDPAIKASFLLFAIHLVPVLCRRQWLNRYQCACDVRCLDREQFFSRWLGNRSQPVCMFLLHVLEEVTNKPGVPKVLAPILVQTRHGAFDCRTCFLRSTILCFVYHVLEDPRHFVRRVIPEMDEFIEA